MTWAERCLLEANKFWFYSLVCSIGLGLLDTLRLRALPAAHAQDQQEPHEMSKSETAIPGKDKHANPDPKATTTDELLASKSSLLRQKILADACDLLLPGTAVGWIQASPLSVGIAMAVSSYITSVEVWMKIAVDLS